MADTKAPVAIRVSRPYGTEDELVEREADAFSKSGIVLLGAQERPVGAVLRFELTLSDGKAVMRGEGRVTGMKTVAGQVGLAVRFTRLDSKSKALIDRANALREARRPVSNRPSGPAPEALQSEPAKDLPEPLPSDPVKDAPEAAPSEPAMIVAAPSEPALVVAAPSEPSLPPSTEPPTEPTRPKSPEVSAPADRSAVLARLRERSQKLSPEQVAKILASAPR